MGLLDRLAPRKVEGEPSATAVVVEDPVFPTKALRKFLSALTSRESPVLVDLGPVVGPNVSFFGEQLGCKIVVEDIFADLERHLQQGKLEALPEFLAKRFTGHEDGTVHGILCWDLLDYLDRASAQSLTDQLQRILSVDGALLGLFGGTPTLESSYTKYIIADEVNLKHRSYPAARGRQTSLQNRDIIRLFGTLRVSESFLLKNNLREILFRKPA